MLVGKVKSRVFSLRWKKEYHGFVMMEMVHLGGIDAMRERREMVEVLSSADKRNTGRVLLSPEAQRGDLPKETEPRFDTGICLQSPALTATGLASGNPVSQ